MAATPSRRWLQFTLRSLFLVITVSAIWMGGLTNRAHRQRHAVRILRESYTELYYEYDDLWDEAPYVPGQEMMEMRHGRVYEISAGRSNEWRHPFPLPITGLSRFQNWLGEDYFRTVVALEHHGGEEGPVIFSREWQAISQLHGLRGLELEGIESIRDDDLACLENLKSLERLFLSWTPIGDRGLEKLSGLTNLRYLGLEHTKITDDGLAHLQNLSRLELLELRDTEITDAGLLHLRLLKGPTTIYLSGTKVTEQGANELQAALPKCRVSLVSPVNCPIDEYKGPPPRGGFF